MSLAGSRQRDVDAGVYGDELNKDYIRLAKAKACRGSHHGEARDEKRLRSDGQYRRLPSCSPYRGPYTSSLCTRSQAWADFWVDAIQRQDITMVQALVLIFSTLGYSAIP
jgi:hypothetical protein